MVRRLLQLNSTQINWFDSSMGSTCQVGYATAVRRVGKRRSKHVLNSIHKSYKRIDLNVIDWANATKIHTPPSDKRYFPPWRACAAQRQFRHREWRAIEIHCWHRTGAWWKCVVHVSWTRNINAWSVITKWHLIQNQPLLRQIFKEPPIIS